MKRNPVLLIFIFFLPGIFMVLTCISIGIDPVDLPVGVVNFETNCSGVNLNVGGGTESLILEFFSTQASCEADVLSCYYLDALNKTEAVLLVRLPFHIFLLVSFIQSCQHLNYQGALRWPRVNVRRNKNCRNPWSYHSASELFTQVGYYFKMKVDLPLSMAASWNVCWSRICTRSGFTTMALRRVMR